MGIDLRYFSILAKVIKAYPKTAPLDVAFLSYPDLMLTPEQVINEFDFIDKKEIVYRSDSEEIKRWHDIRGAKHLDQIIETKDLMKKLGCNPIFFDFKKTRGDEIILDLNLPLESIHLGRYDLVIDTGTLEHCFNVGVAFENMCKLVKVNGAILTAAPVTMVNHGFWSFNPCLYENYFRHNKFDILHLSIAFLKNNKIALLNMLDKSQANTRILNVPSDTSIMAVAKRTIHSTYEFPIQEKYKTD